MKLLSIFVSLCLLMGTTSPLAAAVDANRLKVERLNDALTQEAALIQQVPVFILTSGGYYEAYLDVLKQKRQAPEMYLSASQVRSLLNAESKKVVRTLKKNAWKPGGERFLQSVDVGVQILMMAVLMVVVGTHSQAIAGRYTQWNVRASYGRLGGLSALSTKGGHWLSRFLLGGPWNGYGRVLLQDLLLDLTLFSVVVSPLADAYNRFVPRLVNLRYLSDMKLAFHQSEAILLAWQQLNNPEAAVDGVLLDYDGSEVKEDELNRLQWHNKQAQHEHLVLLYALRYLNHYLQTSQDKHRDELVLLELLHLSLPFGSEHESANGVKVSGNPGRLFYPQEREDVLKTLRELKEMEEFLQEHDIVGKCQRDMPFQNGIYYPDLATCVKQTYQEKRYGGILS